MRIANNNDIDKISLIRIKQQKDDWKEEYVDKYDLFETTKLYLKIYNLILLLEWIPHGKQF